MSAERIFEDYLEDILEYAEKAHYGSVPLFGGNSDG